MQKTVADLVGSCFIRVNLLAYAENHGLVTRNGNLIQTNQAGIEHLRNHNTPSFVDGLLEPVVQRKEMYNLKKYNINGTEYTVKELCRITGLSDECIRDRLRDGRPIL